MNSSTLRGAVIACGAFAALLGTPAESHAIFHWFGCNWFGGGYAYRPVVVGASPQVCGYAPQTCGYTPQTSYRLQVVSVPTTSYARTSACDPCTGSLVTTMRPVTTYVRRVQYVPYTSYRPVYASACSPCATGACPTTTNYAPSTCSSCAPASSTSVPYTGVPTSYDGTYNGTPTTQGGSTYTPQPSLAPDSATTPEPQTYQRPTTPADMEQPQPGPANETSTSFQLNSEAPRLIDPDDRTAVRPIPRIWGHAPILPPSGTSKYGKARIVPAVHRQAVDASTKPVPSVPSAISSQADTQQPVQQSVWRSSNR